MDARTRRKMRRQMERELTAQGVDIEGLWHYEPRRPEKQPKPVPGKDFFQETADTQLRFDTNDWDNNLNEVLAFIKAATDQDKFDEKGNYKPDASHWSWSQNCSCKYVNIRIDMRDGGFVLINKDGERISLDALKWQYGQN